MPEKVFKNPADQAAAFNDIDDFEPPETIDGDYERSWGPVDTKEKYDAYLKWKKNGDYAPESQENSGSDKELDELDNNPIYWATKVLEEPQEYDEDTLRVATYIQKRWGQYGGNK